jgi:uncharacterized membrane protein YgcG
MTTDEAPIGLPTWPYSPLRGFVWPMSAVSNLRQREGRFSRRLLWGRRSRRRRAVSGLGRWTSAWRPAGRRRGTCGDCPRLRAGFCRCRRVARRPAHRWQIRCRARVVDADPAKGSYAGLLWPLLYRLRGRPSSPILPRGAHRDAILDPLSRLRASGRRCTPIMATRLATGTAAMPATASHPPAEARPSRAVGMTSSNAASTAGRTLPCLETKILRASMLDAIEGSGAGSTSGSSSAGVQGGGGEQRGGGDSSGDQEDQVGESAAQCGG